MLISLFFSISNNVDYQANSNEAFIPDSYFVLEGNEAPDYRYMYQNFDMTTSSGICLASSASRQSAELVHLTENGAYKHWVSYNDTGPIDNAYFADLVDTNSYYFTEPTDIVAPQACIVKTKSTDGGGHSMLLETTDGRYTLYFTGMERWFCCRSRSVPDGVDPKNYTWVHTCNVYGKTIPQGYLIGRAVEGTSFTIQDSSGRTVSLEEFYKN